MTTTASTATTTHTDTVVYSCDDHLDLRAVPPTLWESRLPAVLAEAGPRVVERGGERVWVCEGRVLGGSGLPPNASLLKSLSAIGRAGIDDDGYRAGTAALRLLDLDRDGLAASVVYGPLALGLPVTDPALMDAVYAAWNDWAVEEFAAAAPDRLSALAFLPSHSPEAAAAELARCATIGHRGAIIDVFAIDPGDPEWDRLWGTAAETGLPISFHLKDGTSSGLRYQVGKWQSAAFATVLPLQLDERLAIVLFSGVLERNPGLTLVLAESGLGWLPYFLARADLEWRELGPKIDDAPKVAPSELFRRQVYATFEEDAHADLFVPMLGADRCMWASDYPHTDSTFPESRRAIAETLSGLSAADRHLVTAANCARLYGFPLD
ncbi:MAG: amidohydrolase family protein [Actinomycetes bacterium]